jgi:MFS family permease
LVYGHSNEHQIRALPDPIIPAASVGYIIGPILGGLLSSVAGRAFPVYMSCLLFLLNTVIILIFVPQNSHSGKTHHGEEQRTSVKPQTQVNGTVIAPLSVGQVLMTPRLLVLYLVKFLSTLVRALFSL